MARRRLRHRGQAGTTLVELVVTLMWITRSFEIFYTHDRRPLIRIGDPLEVIYSTEGRDATRAEVLESMAGGLPFLLDETPITRRQFATFLTMWGMDRDDAGHELHGPARRCH